MSLARKGANVLAATWFLVPLKFLVVEVLVVRFSSQYCTDGGRAINNFEPEWPDTLAGFAKRAYEFWQKELEPKGYKVRAQIMDFPGGVPGDVGLFLRW